MTLILGGSGIITTNLANQGSQYFDYGSLPLHSPWIMHNARTQTVDTMLTLISVGCCIVSTNISNTGCHFFDYGLLPLHSALIMQDERTRIVDDPLMLFSTMGYQACHFPLHLLR